MNIAVNYIHRKHANNAIFNTLSPLSYIVFNTFYGKLDNNDILIIITHSSDATDNPIQTKHVCR